MKSDRSFEETNGKRCLSASWRGNAEANKAALIRRVCRMQGFRLIIISLLLALGSFSMPHLAMADGWSWVSGTVAMVQNPGDNSSTWVNMYGLNMHVKPGKTNWVHISIPAILQSSPKASKISLELFTGSSDVNVTAVKLTSLATYYVQDITVTPFGCSDHTRYQFVELSLGAPADFPFGVTISLAVTAGSDSSASHRFCLAGAGVYWVTSTATAVELSSFSAKSSQTGVRLKWETAQEADNSGFHLLRSATKNGVYKRITKTIIPANGTLWDGAAYSYVDQEAASGKTWYYKLMDIDYSGKKSLHGPVSTAGLKYSGEKVEKQAPGAITFKDGHRFGPELTDGRLPSPPALP